jgi:uncharacterized protein (TIGR02246 family)
MAKRPSKSLKTELVRREHEYLEAVESKDGEAAARLTAPESLVVSGQGAMKVDGAAIKRMVTEHDSSRSYDLDDESAEVVELAEDVAMIAYKLTTTAPDGAMSVAHDADVWVRHDGRWQCALHTEIPAEPRF